MLFWAFERVLFQTIKLQLFDAKRRIPGIDERPEPSQ